MQYRTVVRMFEGRRLLERLVYRWQDNGELGVDWIYLTHYTSRLESSCECNSEPSCFMKNLKFFCYLLFLSLLSFWSFQLINILINLFVNES